MPPSSPPPVTPFHLLTTGRYDGILTTHPENHSSPVYLIEGHHARLQEAARALGFHRATEFLETKCTTPEALLALITQHIKAKSQEALQTPLRLRILLPPDNGPDALDPSTPYTPQIESTPTPHLPVTAFFPESLSTPTTLPPELNSWTIYVLSAPICMPVYPPAVYKTTARSVYDNARRELGRALFPDAIDPAPSVTSEVLLIVRADDGALEISEGSFTTVYLYRGNQWVTPSLKAGGCNGITRRWALSRELCVEGRIEAGGVQAGEVVWVSNGARGFGWGRVEMWPGIAPQVLDST